MAPSSWCSSMKITVRSKFASSSGGVATRRRPFVGGEPGIIPPVCHFARPEPFHGSASATTPMVDVVADAESVRPMWLHDHAVMCMFMQMSGASIAVGIIGASGFTGAELLRLAAQHPDFDIRVATGDSMAGRRAADLYPSLEVAYPDLVFSEFDPDEVTGLDLVFLGLPHGASMDLAPSLVGSRRLRRRSLGCLPAEGSGRLSDVLRLRTHATRPAGRGGVRTAGTASQRPEGRPARRHTRLPCHRRHARAAAARRCRPDRDDGRRRQHTDGHHRRRTGADRHQRVHQHRLQRRPLRPPVAPTHARDGTGDRRPAASSRRISSP